MSQIFKPLSGGGPIPPAIPTSFTTDVRDNTTTSPGTAVPAANNLELLGRDTTQNDNDGIRTDADPNNGKFLYVELTNRLQGTVTTVGEQTLPIITFTPTVVGTYAIEIRVAAFNTTSTLGAGYSVFGTARFDGVNSNLCGTADKIVNEEGTMANPPPDGANVTFTVSGASILINGDGYAGQTINWSAVALYTFVGA